MPIPSQRLPCVCPPGADEPLIPPYRCFLAPHCLQEKVPSPVFIVFRVLQMVHPPASQNTSCHSPAGLSAHDTQPVPPVEPGHPPHPNASTWWAQPRRPGSKTSLLCCASPSLAELAPHPAPLYGNR